MVVCELMDLAPSSFFTTWLVLSALAAMSVLMLSGSVFRKFYLWPTYETWRYKMNAEYPPADTIRLEVLQTLKGIAGATFNPALALYVTQLGKGQAYCGVGEHGWSWLAISFFVIWLVTDFWSWAYHYSGHRFSAMWWFHHHHHVFFNPSPFAVIADEIPDQVLRALPMFWLPLVVPINMDMLFLEYTLFFYAYGVYLHSGFEMDWPDAHHPWINTGYHHYLHHAVSFKNRPYHTGFMVQFWDMIAGSIYPKERCFCSKCARAKGERDFSEWEKLKKVDYSPLFTFSFWLHGGDQKKKAEKVVPVVQGPLSVSLLASMPQGTRQTEK